MIFQIKNDSIYFKEYDLTNHMDIKEINVDMEEKVCFVTAEFRASVDLVTKGVLFGMVAEMDNANLVDLKEHIEAELKERVN